MAVMVMDGRQEAKFNMYNVVITRCDENDAIVVTNLGFKNALLDFKGFTAQLASHAQIAGAVITGIAADKGVSAKDLCALAARIAGLIYAYAAKTANNTLKQSVNFSKSDLRGLKDAELAPVCQNIHDAGTANLAALGDFGVTAPKLAELQTAIDGYTSKVSKPRDAIVGRKVTKANIKQLFKDADAVLKDQMDRLIEDFAEDNPDFVAQYKSARIIIDPKPKNNGEGGENAEGGNAGGENPPV